MFRVNYYAPIFGFVGWEVFTQYDSNIMEKTVPFEVYRMSKEVGETVTAKILRF